MTWLIKFFAIYTLVVDQKIVLFRVLKFKRVDISWPIRFVFLLICFIAKKFSVNSFLIQISRMFLFYVFSWLVKKSKNVISMLMRFWSKISRMFLCMLLFIILRLKYVHSINSISTLDTETPALLKDLRYNRRQKSVNGISTLGILFLRWGFLIWELMLFIIIIADFLSSSS